MTTKTITKVIHLLLALLKWILALLIFLFSVATLMGHSYVQTILLWLTVAVLLYWPSKIRRKWNKKTSSILRWATAILLLLVSIVGFKPETKTSIYTSGEYREELMQIYDRHLQNWPAGTEALTIETSYGTAHVLACGNPENPPLVMVHAASMGAFSWMDNLDPLTDHYRIYSVDNIGEGNKSELKDPLVFPKSQEEIADHFAEIMNALGIERAPVFGASNGGFVSMCYTYYYPNRVESLSLFGPMGLTQLSSKSMMMLSIASMYPFQFIREGVTRWALGEDPGVHQKYGEWFGCILKGTIPSLGMPVPMSLDQKSEMNLPVLLFLGTEDRIVGDVETARTTAEEYPDIRIEVLESGHLIATEHADYVNSVVSDFLGVE